MGKIAIISDIHGNLTALNAVLDDIKSRGVDKIMCLGDMIVKCSSPKECVDKILKSCEVVVKGNCEERGVEDPRIDEHIWNREKLTQKQREIISNLPLSYDFYISGYKVRIMHASPRSIHQKSFFWNFDSEFDEHFNFMFENTEYLGNIGQETPDIVIFGHIHRPFIVRRKDRVLINPGAVSNASDILKIDEEDVFYGSYLILDGDIGSKKKSRLSYKIIKFTYNNVIEANKIINSDMPNKEQAYEEMMTGKYFSRLKLHLEAEKKRNG
ncbi:MAG: metallophosphoesterase family protein [Clostridia bacterium]|jgi:protein phosphatase|nr:metallophosphoesterase family protein [Clostridia bacterium]